MRPTLDTVGAPVIYSVSLVYTDGVSATGTITTNGNTGVLTAGDIVDWNLVLNDFNPPTFGLEGPLSGDNSGVLVTGSDLTATSTGLFFNFDSSPSCLQIESPAIGAPIPFDSEFCAVAPVAASDDFSDFFNIDLSSSGRKRVGWRKLGRQFQSRRPSLY